MIAVPEPYKLTITQVDGHRADIAALPSGDLEVRLVAADGRSWIGVCGGIDDAMLLHAKMLTEQFGMSS